MEKSGFPLESSGKKGYLSVPKPLFHFGRKCWALPPGWSNFQWNAVILSVTQWDSMAISKRYLPGGRMGCEKINNNALSGFNGWPISRTSPTDIRITTPTLNRW